MYWEEEENISKTKSKKPQVKKVVKSNKVATKPSSKKLSSVSQEPSKKNANVEKKSKDKKKASKIQPKQSNKKPVSKKAKVAGKTTSKTNDQSTTDSETMSETSPQNEPKKDYLHAYEDPNWEGNEDDAGSVASGVLEEDFCFVCGLSTLSSDQWNNVVLCDICDGEYHLKCVGLNKLPRTSFVCYKCIEEKEKQKTLDFQVSSDLFPIPKKRKTSQDQGVVYSPSRPLDHAWEECKAKGLMLVSEVFDYDTMKVLTHGTLAKRTSSGRAADKWLGAISEISIRINTGCHNLIDREGRYDLKLPDFVVDELQLEQKLEPILEKLRSIMSAKPEIRTHNVVFVPVGCHSQQWHADDCMKKRKQPRYFTILIHLNSLDSGCGGTEVYSDKTKRTDLVRGRPGDALVFDGSLLHRGQANLGRTHRFFYYCSFSCGIDMNVGMT